MHVPRLGDEEGKRRLVTSLSNVASLSFATLFLLTFMTPSWRYGPFAWFPIWRFELLAGGPVELGLFNLLPFLLAASWLPGRLLDHRWETGIRAKWHWGKPGITIPLLGLSLLGLFSLDATSPRHTFIYAGGLALAWLVYLFVLNERPKLTFVLAAVALVQGSVSVAQFLNQSDLGISLIGELPLNPAFEGVSVIWARDQAWLRAYGLTAHPNLLGAILAATLLLMLPAYKHDGNRKIPLLVAFNVGLLGMLSTFSRAAILAFVAGLIFWLALKAKSRGASLRSLASPFQLRNPSLLIPLLASAIFLLSYGDLAMSRVLGLEAPTEARSISERQAASGQALDVITINPVTGVGLGNYSSVASRLFEGAVRVHNVPLLVTAELGLLALIFWLWLALSPFWYLLSPARPITSSPAHPLTVAPTHVWLAVLIIGLFDTTLWLTSNWQTAILFAVIVAKLAQDN
jgi:hypothetical protein